MRTPSGDQALKWYYPACATPAQEDIVRQLVDRGFDDDRFLWPRDFVSDGRGGFGYLMDIRPDRFKGLPMLFRRKLRTTIRALLTACLYTVEAYQALHSRGIAYRDISWGNIFFDPATGEVLVCDNDNAVVEGDSTGISGTMEFMAPELVRGEPGVAPGTQSDLHSLSVLLFMLLMNHHPLKGQRELAIRCLDEVAERKLYGKQPLFVFDPQDRSNAPDPVEHSTVLATWGVVPDSLRDLFTKNFTTGLHDPAARVRESQWRDTLRAVLDAVVDCAHCGKQNMTEPLAATASPCWNCGSTLVLPPRLVLTTPPPRTEHHILLHRSSRVQAHHLAPEAGPARLRRRHAGGAAHRTSAAAGEVRAGQPLRFGLDGHPRGRQHAGDRARADRAVALGAGAGLRRCAGRRPHEVRRPGAARRTGAPDGAGAGAGAGVSPAAG